MRMRMQIRTAYIHLNQHNHQHLAFMITKQIVVILLIHSMYIHYHIGMRHYLILLFLVINHIV